MDLLEHPAAGVVERRAAHFVEHRAHHRGDPDELGGAGDLLALLLAAAGSGIAGALTVGGAVDQFRLHALAPFVIVVRRVVDTILHGTEDTGSGAPACGGCTGTSRDGHETWRTAVAADGTWKIDLKTPMGAQAVTLVLVTDGSALSGSLQSAMGGADFTDGTVDGDNLAWTVKLTQPMPIEVDLAATVDGDSISGTAKLGSFGDATFEGARQ